MTINSAMPRFRHLVAATNLRHFHYCKVSKVRTLITSTSSKLSISLTLEAHNYEKAWKRVGWLKCVPIVGQSISVKQRYSNYTKRRKEKHCWKNSINPMIFFSYQFKLYSSLISQHLDGQHVWSVHNLMGLLTTGQFYCHFSTLIGHCFKGQLLQWKPYLLFRLNPNRKQ